MRHQTQKGFCGIFIGIPQHQKWYLVYVPSTKKIISSYDVFFDEIISSTLEYKSQNYEEAMYMRMDVSYIPCATSSKEQTRDIIMFTQFEEGNIVSETRNDAESSDKYDDDSIMTPLLIVEEIYAMDSGDESEDEPISTDILEDICDGIQFHTDLDRI